MVIGAGNDGTSPLEKLGNPLVEATQLFGRSIASLARRFQRGAGYAGLAGLFDAFYGAVSRGEGRSPVPADQLHRVVKIYEELVTAVRHQVPSPATLIARKSGRTAERPLALVTGASGFLGREIVAQLARRGWRVRGIGRSETPDNPHLAEWIRGDLSRGVPGWRAQRRSGGRSRSRRDCSWYRRSSQEYR